MSVTGSAGGWTHGQRIAQTLNIAAQTVHAHLRNIFRKLAVTTRPEAAGFSSHPHG